MPGLGFSCPVIWGDKLFVTAAVSQADDGQKVRVGLYGDIQSVGDEGAMHFKVFCLDQRAGKLLWERPARSGVPTGQRGG